MINYINGRPYLNVVFPERHFATEEERFYFECDIFRVDGHVVCPICNKTYNKHPLDGTILSNDGVPYLNVGCDGTLLKL
jgi:hypothetical protein